MKRLCMALFFLVACQLGETAVPPAEEQLKSLPYNVWAPVEHDGAAKQGVTQVDLEAAFNGTAVYCSENMSEVLFIDIKGKVLRNLSTRECKLAKPYGQDFLVLQNEKALHRVDADSKIVWSLEGRFHHDMAVSQTGDIYALMHVNARFPAIIKDKLVTDNHVVVISPEGKIKGSLSLAEVLSKDARLLGLLKEKYEGQELFGAADVFHVNSIELVESESFFPKGTILLGIRHMNLIAALDIDDEMLFWYWGSDELDTPHNPTLLPSGNLLVFDNGYHRKYSRVIEVNPETLVIEWEYKADDFFTPTRGSAQRLPNGNTLITESDKGHAFEITGDGRVVWEFWNPTMYENKRGTIYRMTRYDKSILEKV